MPTRHIDQRRVQCLNDADTADGDYTLYWMQQSQRAELNHALEFAIQRANRQGNRLLVCFGLMEDYPDANRRHFQFMLEGLAETQAALKRRAIPLVVRKGQPAEVALKLGQRATELICDRGYLAHQRQWRKRLANEAPCRVWQVESDAIVPVGVASDKAEYAARTIRPKLQDASDEFLIDLATTPLDKHSLNLGIRGIDVSNPTRVADRLAIDQDVGPVGELAGGTSQAKARLKRFLSEALSAYDDRSAILQNNVSHLSPYLHFGQISPLAVALRVKSSRGHATDVKQSFLEELLVRRELAINFVTYNRHYDSLQCLPDWAAETLNDHEDDARPHRYTAAELEAGQSHDPAWNAAMIDMKRSGYLHNHLRMYWGKKIIEWTNTTQHAYRVALTLNNRYFLDGRDANSYANIAWLFGLHDRPHQEREIFGKIRYMSFAGLKRKFDVRKYVHNVADRFDEPRLKDDWETYQDPS